MRKSRRRVFQAVAAAGTALAAAAAAAGCGVAGAESESVAAKRSLVVGVKADQPGLGLRAPNGTYSGFDVDVALYIAERLGVPRDRVTIRTTPSSIREKALRDGTVDMIVATYSITAQRKRQVTFAGPYYVPHQDTLVRESDTSIANVRDLRGKRLCEVTGSNSFRRVAEEREIAAIPVKSPTYSKCMDMLTAGQVDAVSTDDLILAGFAVGRPVRIINAPFTDEKYGVGLRKGDLDGCEAINRAITQMYQSGHAGRLLNKWFRSSGLKLTASVPQFEGCS
jgi:glutamate transport system substrate-binding protein